MPSSSTASSHKSPGDDRGSDKRKKRSSSDGPSRSRQAVACMRCRKRKIRCIGNPNTGERCRACLRDDVHPSECQFNRVSQDEELERQRQQDQVNSIELRIRGGATGPGSMLHSLAPATAGPSAMPALPGSDLFGSHPYGGWPGSDSQPRVSASSFHMHQPPPFGATPAYPMLPPLVNTASSTVYSPTGQQFTITYVPPRVIDPNNFPTHIPVFYTACPDPSHLPEGRDHEQESSEEDEDDDDDSS